jgi:hypothetical protein
MRQLGGALRELLQLFAGLCPAMGGRMLRSLAPEMKQYR